MDTHADGRIHTDTHTHTHTQRADSHRNRHRHRTQRQKWRYIVHTELLLQKFLGLQTIRLPTFS